MTKLKPLRWFSMLFILLATNSVSIASPCTREYRFVAELDLENAGPNMGNTVLRHIMAQAGCKLIQVHSDPNFARRHKMLGDGEVDVLSEASMRPERLVYGLFSIPYRFETTHLFVLADRANQFEGVTLEKIEHGDWRVLDSGSWHGEHWESMRNALKKRNLMIAQRSMEEGLRVLRLGRADILMATDLSELTILKNATDLSRLPFTVNVEPVHLLFSRRTVSKADVEQINEAIQVLKQQQLL